MWAWLDRHQRRIALAGITLLMVVGFALHRDYGVRWDEPFQRGYGQLVSRYVFSGNWAPASPAMGHIWGMIFGSQRSPLMYRWRSEGS